MKTKGHPGAVRVALAVALALALPANVLAGACPADAQAAAQWVLGQREISRLDPECTVDCADERTVEGKGLSLLDAEPRKVRVARDAEGRVTGLAAALPGGFPRHAPAFDAAYVRASAGGSGKCDDLLCGWRRDAIAGDASALLLGADLQPLPFIDDETWLFCWYVLPPR